MAQAAQPSTARAAQGAILAVDDDAVALMMMEGLVARLGYPVLSATSGEQAVQMLLENPGVAAVLMDREMPGMNGIDAIRKIKANRTLESIPVIMVTGANEPEQMKEGIEAGVFYYLEKPADAGLLASVLSAALRQSEETQALRNSQDTTLGFDLTTAARFEFRTMTEAAALAGFVANYFPDPKRCIQGIAALCYNAVEHGLCDIGFETKGKLIADGVLEMEIDRRLKEAAGKKASLTMSRRTDGVFLVVEDPGPGFDWRDFMRFDVGRSGSTHGRGIAMASATAFDDLKYSETGNKVVACVRGRDDFEW